MKKIVLVLSLATLHVVKVSIAADVLPRLPREVPSLLTCLSAPAFRMIERAPIGFTAQEDGQMACGRVVHLSDQALSLSYKELMGHIAYVLRTKGDFLYEIRALRMLLPNAEERMLLPVGAAAFREAKCLVDDILRMQQACSDSEEVLRGIKLLQRCFERYHFGRVWQPLGVLAEREELLLLLANMWAAIDGQDVGADDSNECIISFHNLLCSLKCIAAAAGVVGRCSPAAIVESRILDIDFPSTESVVADAKRLVQEAFSTLCGVLGVNNELEATFAQ